MLVVPVVVVVVVGIVVVVEVVVQVGMLGAYYACLGLRWATLGAYWACLGLRWATWAGVKPSPRPPGWSQSSSREKKCLSWLTLGHIGPRGLHF